LNRLRYEIELEQRSIRLFRQYKIIIAVISGSIVFLVWFLYHSRAGALAPQPASPLFSTPANPFEEIYNFHHGERPTLPSPASTLGLTSSQILAPPIPTPSAATTALPASSSSLPALSVEKDRNPVGFAPSETEDEHQNDYASKDINGQKSNSYSHDVPSIDTLRGHLADLDIQDDLDTIVPDHNEL